MGASFSDSPLSSLMLGPEFERAVLWRNCVDEGTVSVLDIVRLASTSTHARHWCRAQIEAGNREDLQRLLRAMALVPLLETTTLMTLGRLHWMAPVLEVPHSGEIYEPEQYLRISGIDITAGKHLLAAFPGKRDDLGQGYRGAFTRGIRLPLIEDAVRVALKRPAPATALDGEPDPKRQRTS